MTDEPGWARPAVVVGLALLAVGLWTGALGGPAEKRDAAPLDPKSYSTDTVRKVRKSMTFDGAPCQSCHEGKEALQGDPREKGIFHEAIKLQHGRNQHCFNCHHRLQPADFSNFDGAPIKLADVQLLCARCHGTTYRDWQQGSHGRRTGSWDSAKASKNTVCIACHEPHWPVFKPLQAAPPPQVNPHGGEQGGHH
ncbi:MAG: hypothetical protein HY553_16895 [Elusimicrobia bacterium]|nr:hypothetical protein [Elusimicrobiota bacterium]